MFSNFFEDFFRRNRQRVERPDDDDPLKNNFRNPIWRNDDEDDDLDDFRHPSNNFHIRIESDPFEIMRFAESEMDNLFKSFSHMFIQDDFFKADQHMPSLVAPEFQGKSLREQVLKDEKLDNFNSLDNSEVKRDTDLDGRITPQNFVKLWNHEKNPAPQTFFKMSIKEFIRHPDGSTEEKHTYTDNDGNQKTIITRQAGDSKYTITKDNGQIQQLHREDSDKNQILLPKEKDSNESIFNYSALWRKIFDIGSKQ